MLRQQHSSGGTAEAPRMRQPCGAAVPAPQRRAPAAATAQRIPGRGASVLLGKTALAVCSLLLNACETLRKRLRCLLKDRMAVKHYYFRHYYFLSCNIKLAEESEIQKSGVLGQHLKNQCVFSMFIYLLLQYGFINTCLKSLVVEKYGEETWEKLR